MDGTLSIFEFLPTGLPFVRNLILIAVLLFLSAMASGSETAMFSLSPAALERIGKLRKKSDEAVLKLLENKERLLATILIVNNLINILTVLLCNRTLNMAVSIHSTGMEFLVKTVLITFILLLFGEIMPKLFANYSPERIASLTAVPLLFTSRILKPASALLERYSHTVLDHAPRESISIDELGDALEIASVKSGEEKRMLRDILRFTGTEVGDIMRPRVEITAIDSQTGFDRVRQTVISSGYSRIPVYEGTIDHIVGILYVKDLIPSIHMSDSFAWKSCMRSPYYTTDSKKITDLLDDFRNDKVHMAIVVDEYGSTKGLITMEDILEEIVGDISDESDREESSFVRIDDNTYVFDARTGILEMERTMGLPDGTFDDVKGEAETVAGLMLEIRKDFLKEGDRIRSHGLTLTVTAASGRKADRIKVERQSKKS